MSNRIVGRTGARLAGAMLAMVLGVSSGIAGDGALPRDVPAGTKLVVADQNEALQTLIRASGAQDRLNADVSYANFLGGPAILEAFRAGALDLAVVGNTPPIQAHAAGENIPIVAAVVASSVDYNLAVRPGLKVERLEDLKGLKLSYSEGTGRQPFILNALKTAGLKPSDVTFVNLRAADIPDSVRTSQVDIAVINEPHFSRYLNDFADRGASALSDAEHDRLPRSVSYLYASGKSLADPAKAAAIAEFVKEWIAAKKWSHANRDDWNKAYYVDLQKLSPEDGRKIIDAEGELSFPLLSAQIPYQQGLVDIIYEAGDLPKKLDAAEQFDTRFDTVIAEAAGDS